MVIKGNGNMILSDSEKRKMISSLEKKFKGILVDLKLDVENDQQIKETPRRWAKMMVNETLNGCYSPEPEVTVFDNIDKIEDMVFLGPVQVHSICSHHTKDFIGSAFLCYIPNEKICGISKLARIVNWFSKRLQIQEELTKQIADYVMEKLNPLGCAVYIKAQHLCMKTRGTEEPNSFMITSAVRGVFTKLETKQEFLSMVNGFK